MKNFNFLKFFLGAMLLIATAFITSCVDDNDDTEAPYLKVSPTNLNFTTSGIPAEGSQAFFEISTNRHWTATVKDNKTWVTLSATKGDGSATVQVSIPEKITDQASIVIEISNKVGPLLQETVTITSGSVVPGVAIYHETFGTEAPDKSPYPFVDQYIGWVKSGEGSATVEYSGSATSLRQSGKLSAGYEDASGGTKLFFGANANFVINKLSLTNDQTNLRLTFGGSYSKNVEGVYDNVFKPEKFHFYLSADGVSWSNAIEYSTQQADEYWVFATSNFTLKSAVSMLYIKYAADEASVFSIDDPTLSTGNGGTVIDLGRGSVDPEPGDAIPITIPELNAKMTTAGTVIDATADRYFEAVVQNDVAGNNYSFSNLILAAEGATTAGNGITLYGEKVDPATLKVKKGDKVKVTLYKGLAQAKNFNGMYEVTGAAEATWAKVENVGTANITPVVITADQLSAYQGMTVTINDATPAAAGIWATSTDNALTFTAGSEFTVFCKKEAAAFFNIPFAKVKGNITGLAAVYKNNAQLVPRNLADVSAFNSTDPTIVSVTPSSLNFPANGGVKEVSVEIINSNNKMLSVNGLSGTLKATVNGTTVTVEAAENTGAAVNQTLTISLEDGNSVSVSITQSAAGASEGSLVSMTSAEIASGKTGSVALVSNAYGSQAVNNPSTWYTWSVNSIDFTGARIAIAPDANGGGIQVQGNASDVAKQGRIANVTALPGIQSMVVVLRTATSSNFDPAYNVYAGTAANPSGANSKIAATSTMETVGDYKVYTQTFDFTGGNYSYFTIMNDLVGALYIDSIKITYKK